MSYKRDWEQILNRVLFFAEGQGLEPRYSPSEQYYFYAFLFNKVFK